MKNNIQRICILALTAPFFTACLDDCISYSCAEVVPPIVPSTPLDEKNCKSECSSNLKEERKICESNRWGIFTTSCIYGCDIKTGKCKENEYNTPSAPSNPVESCTSKCVDEKNLSTCIDGKLATIPCTYGCNTKLARCRSESEQPQSVTLNGAPHLCPNGLGLKATGTTSSYFVHTVYTGCRCDSSYKTRCAPQEGDIVLFRCYNNEEQYTTCSSTCSNGASKCW